MGTEDNTPGSGEAALPGTGRIRARAGVLEGCSRGSLTAVDILAKPGARRETVSWDRWRKRWTVACRPPAIDGRANEALLRVLATRLAVDPERLRLVRGVRGRLKTVEVPGLSSEEIDRRLAASAEADLPR